MMREWLVNIQHDLHMHPELSDKEYETTKKIKKVLLEQGVEVSSFEDLTGAIGIVKGDGFKNAFGLRADIDALPIYELNELPYKSRNEGVMHACGHDAHTTILLGVAKKMRELDLHGKLKGDVKFIFQPAEELGTGARRMIEKGVLEKPHVNQVIACHLFHEIPVGKVGININKCFVSSDVFSITIQGKGTHGARPNEGIDPIVAGSFFVNAVQSVISRNISPLDSGVVSVSKFVAGQSTNVIPEYAKLEGSIRALTNEVKKGIIDRIQEIVDGMKKVFGVSCNFTIHESIPACINNEDISNLLNEAAAHVLGPGNVKYITPTMGSEYFAFYAQERPSAIFRLGCSNKSKGFTYPLHSPYFKFDEDVLMIGVDIFVEMICRYLG